MAKERRDSKNRILNKGEYQKEDGRYMYRYTDADGKTGYVYSWTLTKTDRTPKGKPPGMCLREMERQIQLDVNDGIKTRNADMVTLNEYFELYVSQKVGVKPSTRANYRKNYDKHIRPRLGNRKLSSILFTDVKKCYKDILEKDEISVVTLMNIDALVTPIFNLAVRNRLIRFSPAQGVMREIKSEISYTPKVRRALTVDQQRSFIAFVKDHPVYKRWYNMFVFLLGTGCRIGEACALTWDDCDFDRSVIYIKRSLSYYPDEHTRVCSYKLQSPKSAAGIRTIPMLTEVKEVLKQELVNQMKNGFCEVEIDGVSGFVFFNNQGRLFNARNLNPTVYKIVARHNERELEVAPKEGRHPIILPQFSMHTMRHTFCTRLCETGMNVKVVQDVMGHANVSITLNVYNSVTEEFRMKAFSEVDELIKIG